MSGFEVRDCGLHTLAGPRGYTGDRTLNQDLAFVSHRNYGDVFAMFDGHGRFDPVKEPKNSPTLKCSKYIPKLLKHNSRYNTDPKVAMEKTFEDMDQFFKSRNTNGRFEGKGTTASVVWKLKGKEEYVCANIGDSEIMLVTKYGFKMISEIHSPAKEKKRIEEMGNQVYYYGGSARMFRGDGNNGGSISVSRSFGDLQYKAMSAIPHIYSFTKTDDHIAIIIASDGLWTSGYTYFDIYQDILSYIQSNTTAEKIASNIVDTAVNDFGSTDDTTAVVIIL